MEKSRVFGLDLLRVTAIGMIFLAQCVWVFPQLNPLMSKVASVFQFIGFEVFFVLGGFLLFRKFYPLYLRSDFGWPIVGRFLKARLRWILPLYFFAVVLNYALAVFLQMPKDHAWKYLLLLQNFASPMPSFFKNSWILPIVVFATVLFPIVICLFYKMRNPKNKPLFFGILTMILIVLGIFAKLRYQSVTGSTDINRWDVALKAVVIYRIDSVCIGIFSGWVIANNQLFFNRTKLLFAIMGFLGIGFLFAGVGYFHLMIDTHPFFWNVLYLPMSSLIIALFLPLLSNWQTFWLPVRKCVVFISKISFVFFVLNVDWIWQVMRNWFSKHVPSLPIIICVLTGYAFVSIALAVLFFRLGKKHRTD